MFSEDDVSASERQGWIIGELIHTEFAKLSSLPRVKGRAAKPGELYLPFQDAILVPVDITAALRPQEYLVLQRYSTRILDRVNCFRA